MRRAFWILAATLVLSAAVIQVQGAQVVINWSWKKENRISIWNPDPGNTFIVVTAQIWISGYNDFSTNPFYFQLETSSGSYQHSVAMYSLPDHFMADTIPDGASKTGSLAFEIPQTSSVSTLKYDRPLKSYNIRYRGRCLIATAAYGSELAPQVQLLREFRDQKLLSTFAGSQFMAVFDRFYYSFSPQVAEIVSSSPLLATLTRIVITPLLSALSILAFAESELQILLGGVAVSALLGGAYLSLPILLLRTLTRHVTRNDHSRLSLRLQSLVTFVLGVSSSQPLFPPNDGPEQNRESSSDIGGRIFPS